MSWLKEEGEKATKDLLVAVVGCLGVVRPKKTFNKSSGLIVGGGGGGGELGGDARKPLSPDDLMVTMVSVVVKGEGGGGLHGGGETR